MPEKIETALKCAQNRRRGIAKQIRKAVDEANERDTNHIVWPPDAVFQAYYRERMGALESQLRQAEHEILGLRADLAEVIQQMQGRADQFRKGQEAEAARRHERDYTQPPRELLRKRWERYRAAEFDSCLYPGGSIHGRWPR